MRLVFSKAGLDRHDRSVKVRAALLGKAGFEVTCRGLYNTPNMVVFCNWGQVSNFKFSACIT